MATDAEINRAIAQKLGVKQIDGTYLWVQNEIGMCGDLAPDYCGDISLAWSIIDYVMAQENGDYTVAYYWPDGEHSCTFTIGRHHHRAQAKTPAMAICAAFLKFP